MANTGSGFALALHSVALLALLSLFCQTGKCKLTASLASGDQERFANLFSASQPFKDLATAHWAVSGLQLLGRQVGDKKAACAYVQKSVDAKNLKSLYHSAAVANALGDCKLSVTDTTLKEALQKKESVESLYYAASAQLDLGNEIDGAAVIDALSSATNDDDSALSVTRSWLIASRIPGDHSLSSFIEAIEDVLQQADESTESLWFDSGIELTSMFITGAFGLAQKLGSAPPGISGDKLVKLANYFLTNRFTKSVSDVYFVLAALHTLATNKFQVPLVISLVENQPITAENPSIRVRTSDVLGRAVEAVTVTMVSASLDDDADHINNKDFKAVDNSVYEFNFWETEPKRGIYKAFVSATPNADKSSLIADNEIMLVLKVVARVTVGSCDIQVMDKDQSLVAKSIRVSYPDTSTELLEADYHQEIVMKFTLKDTITNNLITAHQTFVRLTHVETKQEIFFVAQADNNDEYTFDLDVGKAASDSFGYLGGKYQLDLIVGDAAIENSFSWFVTTVSLKFEQAASTPTTKEKFIAQPEIHHLFRVPEPRPPRIITLIFTALVVAPIVLLLILWLRLGANLNGFFQSGFYGFLFAIGLGGILFLLFAFWLTLNMFTTLKLVAVVGAFTFLTGQRLLRNIAERKRA
ncbi:dolichyl-diphosphooligosaccharide--protein glycosyltransferase subunit 2-like [Corticium candelabrum]|uniref:dolichyl-diphosphooligosaccharide--protein glycosyltransferase subunit 2-like n=1 Tax=Corticium candelabrum TaxID=121492 RepID=UPI002E2721AB|nr:dolichyl-diphosphooligosaccharide--protein glycosyltransferase subunit 2-like [Corticium candelabrum]